MFLSPGHRILFVHIAKTGGSSVRGALNRLEWSDPYAWAIRAANVLTRATKYRIGSKFPRHAKAVAAWENIGEPFWSELFKFTFVRNPWDLQASSWHHLRRVKGADTDRFPDFRSFLDYKFDADRSPDWHFDISATSQSLYIRDMEGRTILDFVGRYERLHEDFAEACRRGGIEQLELPHIRESKKRARDYREYYDDETRAMVARHYAEDIERFGYDFDDFERKLPPVEL